MSVMPRRASASTIRGSSAQRLVDLVELVDGHVRLLAGAVLPGGDAVVGERDDRLVGLAVVAVPAAGRSPRARRGGSPRERGLRAARAARSSRSASGRSGRARGGARRRPRGSRRARAGRAGGPRRRTLPGGRVVGSSDGRGRQLAGRRRAAEPDVGPDPERAAQRAVPRRGRRLRVPRPGALPRARATRAARAPTPGVRKAIGVDALAADVPQDIHGIDLGPSPTPYERAERLAAEAFGAARSWFLTNGATQGNHALCLALAPLGHADRRPAQLARVDRRRARAERRDPELRRARVRRRARHHALRHARRRSRRRCARRRTRAPRSSSRRPTTAWPPTSPGCAEVAHARRRAARRRPVLGPALRLPRRRCRRPRCRRAPTRCSRARTRSPAR